LLTGKKRITGTREEGTKYYGTCNGAELI